MARSWSPKWLRNDFLRHVATLLVGTTAAQALLLLLTPVLSRLYSPQDYGLFSIYSSIVSTLAVVAALRYDMAIMLPDQDADAKVLKRGATRLILLVCLIATVVCGIAAPMIASAVGDPSLAPWLFLIGLSTFTLAEISALTYWLNRKSEYRAIGVNRVLQSGGTAVAQLGLALAKLGGITGLIIGALLGQTAAWLTLRHKAREVRSGLEESNTSLRKLLRRYRRMPLLNGPNVLVDAVRVNGINIMIGIVYSGSLLGQFYMAWRVLQVPLGLINGALAQVFFQKLSVTERGSMFRFAKASILRSAALGVVPFLIIYFLSPWIFPVVLGAQWGDAGYIAQALVPWLYMSLITSPISTVFVVTETQHYMLIHSIFYAGVPLALLYFLKGDIVSNLSIVAWAMALILVIFAALALWVSTRYDKELQPKPEAPSN
nr:oligosaccharide flippase family protein [Psychromicrobium silvestre]